MATITKLSSGTWRVQIRRKGKYANQTFRRRGDAEQWARAMESRIDRGEPILSREKETKTFAGLIGLHLGDLAEVGKPLGRSKRASMEFLKARLGQFRPAELDRERLIAFGKERAKEGAGPVTVGIDLGYIKTVLSHAAAVHGVPVSIENVDLARIALTRLGLVGKGNERDRRPSEQELARLFRAFDDNPRLTIPMSRIVRFAIATAMRLDEICRVCWADFEPETRMLMIRDRKDPRRKSGNSQRIPLLRATGYDACRLIKEQGPIARGAQWRIFPYNSRSVGTAFRRACRDLGIEDLHFHDLRHEGTSRLFEAGFAIEQVALVTGHKDWKMLRRYTHLKPEQLHAAPAASRSSAGRLPAFFGASMQITYVPTHRRTSSDGQVDRW